MKNKRVRFFMILIGFLLLTAFSINRLVYYNSERVVMSYSEYNSETEKLLSFMEEKSVNYEIKAAANGYYNISVKVRDFSKYQHAIIDYVASIDTSTF